VTNTAKPYSQVVTVIYKAELMYKLMFYITQGPSSK